MKRLLRGALGAGPGKKEYRNCIGKLFNKINNLKIIIE